MNQEIMVTLMEKEVQHKKGRDYRLQLQPVWKFNDIFYMGMTICKDGNRISPIYDFEKYKKQITDGKRIEIVVEEMLKDYDKSQRRFPVSVVCFNDFSMVKDRIQIKLCKKEWNRNYIQGKISRSFLDFEILYYLDVHDMFSCESEVAEIVLTEPYLQQWGVTEEQVFQAALSNLKEKNWFQIFSLDGLLQELAGIEQNNKVSAGRGLYVLTDLSQHNYGGAALFSPEALQKAAVMANGSYYILPSSISELIIVPQSMDISPSEMRFMVKSVNQSSVERRQQLSDNVYYYDAEKGQITMER